MSEEGVRWPATGLLGWPATLVMLGAAMLVSDLPLVSVPFRWIATFAHEMSHASIGLLTGRDIHRLHMDLDGSGFVSTSGHGVRWPKTLAGYLFAPWVGALLASSAARAPRWGRATAAALLLAVAFAAIAWARDVETFAVLAACGGVFALTLRARGHAIPAAIVRFVGLFVLADTMVDPLELLGSSGGHDDGANLAGLSGIPRIVWIVVWEMSAILALLSVLRPGTIVPLRRSELATGANGTPLGGGETDAILARIRSRLGHADRQR